MTPMFSLYLDLIRFLAAIAVFLAHISSSPFTQDTIYWRLTPYGDVAVTIFFVLSGYVIAFVSSTRESSKKKYFTARIARLYSVAGVGLILTLIFDFSGMFINPDFYTNQKVLWKPENWTGYLSSALFINEFQAFGFKGTAPGTNGPYWSLSFEFTYYILAGLVLFFRRIIWLPMTLLILIFAGKTITALLPIWALGFILYRIRTNFQIQRNVSFVLALISAITVIATPLITLQLPNDNYGIWFPFGRGSFNRNLSADYVAAIAFATHLAFARQIMSKPINILPSISSLIRWLGSLTFPLYCFHYPVICFLAAVSPWSISSSSHALFICAFTIALVITLTPLCEHLKRSIHRSLSANWLVNF